MEKNIKAAFAKKIESAAKKVSGDQLAGILLAQGRVEILGMTFVHSNSSELSPRFPPNTRPLQGVD